MNWITLQAWQEQWLSLQEAAHDGQLLAWRINEEVQSWALAQQADAHVVQTLQHQVLQTRMRSAGSIRTRAERAVHITAQSIGKRARLQLGGEAVGMDATAVEPARPLDAYAAQRRGSRHRKPRAAWPQANQKKAAGSVLAPRLTNRAALPRRWARFGFSQNSPTRPGFRLDSNRTKLQRTRAGAADFQPRLFYAQPSQPNLGARCWPGCGA